MIKLALKWVFIQRVIIILLSLPYRIVFETDLQSSILLPVGEQLKLNSSKHELLFGTGQRNFLKFLFSKYHLGFLEHFCLDSAYFYLIAVALLFIDVSIKARFNLSQNSNKCLLTSFAFWFRCLWSVLSMILETRHVSHFLEKRHDQQLILQCTLDSSLIKVICSKMQNKVIEVILKRRSRVIYHAIGLTFEKCLRYVL